MAKTLVELQKEIDKKSDRLEELEKNLREQNEKISDLQKEKMSSKERSEKHNKLVAKKAELASKIHQNETEQEAEKKQFSQKLALYEKSGHDLSKALKEIKQKQSPTEEEKAIFKLFSGQLQPVAKELRELKQYQAEKKRKQTEVYIEERDKLFEIALDLLKDQASLQKLLIDLAPKANGKQTGVSTFEATIGGLGFAVSNISTLVSAATSAKFYSSEAQKLSDILTGKKQNNPDREAFFIKLLEDQKLVEFLRKNTPLLNNLLDRVIPTITPVILAELGKIDAINKEIKEKAARLEKLPELEKNLEALKERNSKQPSKQIEEKIASLESEIKSLKSLKNKKRLAESIQILKKAGLTDEYINATLLPIITGPIKTLLSDPAGLQKIISFGLQYLQTEDPNKRTELLANLLSSIDLEKILGSTRLQQVLASEGPNLANIAVAALSTNPSFQERTKDLGISSDTMRTAIVSSAPLLSSAVPLITKLASKVLENPAPALGLYNSLTELQQLSNRAALTPLTLQEKKKQSEALIAVIQQAGTVVGSLAPTLNTQLPVLLNNPNLVSLAGNLVGQEPLSKIAAPLGINQDVITRVAPSALTVIGDAVPLVTSLASEALKSPTNLATLYNNYSDLQEITAKKKEELTEADRQKQSEALTAVIQQAGAVVGSLAPTLNTQLPILLNNPNLVSLAGNLVGQEPLSKIAAPLGINQDVITRVAPSALTVIGDAVPLVTSLTSEALKNSAEIASLYSNYSDLQEINAKKKEELTEADRQRQTESLTVVIHQAGTVLNTIAPTIDTELPKLLYHYDTIGFIADLVESEPLSKIAAPLGINQNFINNVAPTALRVIGDAVPLVTSIASEALKNPEEIANLYNNFAALREINKKDPETLTEEDRVKQPEALAGVIKGAGHIITAVDPSRLQGFIKDNKQTITRALQATIREEPFKTTLEEMGISSGLIDRTADVGIDLVASLALQVPTLGAIATNNSVELASIAGNLAALQDLSGQAKKYVADDLEKQRTNSPDKEPSPAELPAELQDNIKEATEKLLSSILTLRDKSPELKTLINKEIPQILAQHADRLGPVIDDFLNQTKIGRKLNIEGEEVIKVFAPKFPKLMELARHFHNKEYSKLIVKALPILFDKEVLGIGIKALFDSKDTTNLPPISEHKFKDTTLAASIDLLKENMKEVKGNIKGAKEGMKGLKENIKGVKEAAKELGASFSKHSTKGKEEKQKPFVQQVKGQTKNEGPSLM